MQSSPRSAYEPLVSAVIPTRGRPSLLAAAIRSALRQTWWNLEIVVVVDGPCAKTEAVLAGFSDPRLRVVLLPETCGGSAARNAGVRVARGEWIAFLDDDDEWLPQKIERQIAALRRMHDWFPVVSCRLIARSPRSSRVLPLRCYDSAAPLGDYLFVRSGLTDPGGLMQTSTLLAPRDLLLAIPFREGLERHQDWDWLIRVAACRGVAFHMVPQPLAIWHVEDGRPSISRAAGWRPSLAWIRQVRGMISPRAFSWFVAIQCAWRARQSRAGLGGRLEILRAFLVEGRPEIASFLCLLGFSLIPLRLRRLLRHWLRREDIDPDTTAGLRLVFTQSTPTVLRKTL